MADWIDKHLANSLHSQARVKELQGKNAGLERTLADFVVSHDGNGSGVSPEVSSFFQKGLLIIVVLLLFWFYAWIVYMSITHEPDIRSFHVALVPSTCIYLIIIARYLFLRSKKKLPPEYTLKGHRNIKEQRKRLFVKYVAGGAMLYFVMNAVAFISVYI